MVLDSTRLLIATAVAATLGTACSTVSINRSRAEKIGSVAIVGFRGHNEMTRDDPKGSIGAIQTIQQTARAVDAVSGGAGQRRNEQGANIYALIREQLESGLKWKVRDANEVASNDSYRKLYQSFLGEPGIGLQRMTAIDVDGIVWDHAAARFSHEQRVALMDSLGVDGVAIASVKILTGDTSGVSICGVGKRTFHPKAVVQMALYGRDSPEPIWDDRWAAGEATGEGLSTTMGVDDTGKETELFGAATKSALTALLERYRKN